MFTGLDGVGADASAADVLDHANAVGEALAALTTPTLVCDDCAKVIPTEEPLILCDTCWDREKAALTTPAPDLRKWVQHLPDCHHATDPKTGELLNAYRLLGPCTCGLDQALSGSRGSAPGQT